MGDMDLEAWEEAMGVAREARGCQEVPEAGEEAQRGHRGWSREGAAQGGSGEGAEGARRGVARKGVEAEGGLAREGKGAVEGPREEDSPRPVH